MLSILCCRERYDPKAFFMGAQQTPKRIILLPHCCVQRAYPQLSGVILLVEVRPCLMQTQS